MYHVSGYGSFRIKSENGFHDNVWSDEHDCIPLKLRLKMLLASKRLSGISRVEAEKTSDSPSISQSDVCIKKEDQQFNLQEERNQMFSAEQSHQGMLSDYSWQGTEGNEYLSSNGIKPIEVNGDTDLVKKVDACSNTLTPCSLLSKYAVKAEVDYADHNLAHLFGNGLEGCTEVRAVKMGKEIAYDFVDDLDHVVLKERRRLLLSRKLRKSTKQVMEGNRSLLSAPVVGDTIQHSISRGKKDNHCGDAESLVAGNHNGHVPAKNASDFDMTSKSGTSFLSMQSCQGAKSAKPRVTVIQENNRICSSEKILTTQESFGGHDSVSGSPYSMSGLPLSPTFVNIKAEPWDHDDVHTGKKDAACSYPSSRVVPVKIEFEIPEAFYGDKIDHMLLQDRIKLMASGEPLNLASFRNFECSKKAALSVVDCRSIASEVDKPMRINHPRKKRKTVTDSVEIALEEDAPGLLQVLIDKGVLVNEIKLYGEPESDEALDDSFSELEAVIQNLFYHRQSLLKLPPLRCAKDEKASYCMACLISLVEQARYLQFRKWPVEWGWCRDLQSFIFVFERHNRIVLERPEYGFATYFFELVDSLPIHWQIKRLVTAMKLSSCSRVTLIENKTLMVGEDLTDGEARVLTEYGWIPNSGLGTMLNYCDRVVHDKKNERDSLDWRSKIGQLLMNGYNGGTIVLTDIPKKVPGYSGAQGPEIKLEI